MAIFSSSVFVIALSIIGYYVEKNRLKNMILSNSFMSAFDSTLSVFDENNSTNTQGINSIIIDVMNRLISAKKLLEEYYKGLFIKDEPIKKFINTKLFDFFNDLSDLEVYNACPSRKGDIIGIHFFALVKQHATLADELIELINKKSSKQNNKKKYDDQFIVEYEKKAEQLKNADKNSLRKTEIP